LVPVMGALLTVPVLSAAETQPGPVPVLELGRGSFGVYMQWRTPMLVDKDGKVAPLPEPVRKDQKTAERKPLPIVAAPPPPAGWTSTDFDPSCWPRARGPVVVSIGELGGGLGVPAGGPNYFPGGPADWHLLCLRGSFRVDDPAQVKDLRIALKYHGGAVVYVNGAELTRAHMPAGKIDADTLADRYAGEEAYVRPDGQLYNSRGNEKFVDRLKTRIRSLGAEGADSVTIPAAMLTKGINVIAVEIHAAPISEIQFTGKTADVDWRGTTVCWPHAAVLEASVTAAAAAGLQPAAGASAGVALWNSPSLESEESGDFARPSAKIFPIRMVGARNGTFSGKVVLGSAGVIRGLKAVVSDLILVGGSGKIPAAAVQVRLAEPVKPEVSWGLPQRFDRLLGEFPAEIKPVSVASRERKGPATTAAVAPVWVTVRMPADAAAGLYRGTLSVEAAADGAAPSTFSVPVELKVHDWKIPDPMQFEVYNHLYQSPDTVAQYYKVPLWSDKHLALVAKSLDAFKQLGSRICILTLTCKSSSLNNVDSMVVWVKKPDGGYDYDFSAVDKYMDVFARTVGKPAILQLNLWSHPGDDPSKPWPALSVTVRDPATGKTETLQQPRYGTPESEAFWKPVMAGMRERLEKRGWLDVAAVCHVSYCRPPSAPMVDVCKKLWPDGRWMNCSHANPATYPGTSGSMPVPYSEWVWGCGRLYDPDGEKGGKPAAGLYPRPWKMGASRIEVGNPRYGVSFMEVIRDTSPLSHYRLIDEATVQADVRGIGRVGGDFWPLPDERPGRFVHLCDSYSAVGPANNVCSMTSPGPDGACFNERMEMFREGAQIAEAITFLTQALDGKKVSGDLEQRIRAALDDRARHYLRTRYPFGCAFLSFEGSAWQTRDDLLFSLAAEIVRASGAK
jgi:hypothetical protein